MVSVLWNVFPRLLEQNLNGLLEEAQPTALRALQIFRVCRSQGLWNKSVQEFSRSLEEYFSQPRSDRKKSDFDRHLDHPMNHDTYTLFQLDFRTAAVSDKAIDDLSSWAHNMIRVAKQTESPFISLQVMTAAIRRITSPNRFEKASNFTFKDFCGVWKSTVYKLFGTAEDPEFNEILKELEWIDARLREEATLPPERLSIAPIYLSQTETDWARSVREAAYQGIAAPAFPLSRGPEKNALQELVRVIDLYGISLSSTRPELVKNRERIRLTLLDRCDHLLGNKAKLVG